MLRYWDYLKQLYYDYNRTSREPEDQYTYLNRAELIMANEMQVYYLNVSMHILQSELYEEVHSWYPANETNSFDKERRNVAIVFGVYIGFLLVVGALFWRFFIARIQKELWKTKSILSVLSPELVMNIPEIKSFILKNSSTVLFAKSERG